VAGIILGTAGRAAGAGRGAEIGVAGALSAIVGEKYCARPFSRCLSGFEISHSSMKNAIIAVTKSA
jgi:hypothetical protein